MREFIYTGGVEGMTWILLLGICSVLSAAFAFARRFMKMEYTLLDRRLGFTVIGLGGIAGISGLFFQTLGLYMAYQAIIEAADISPEILMRGIFVSFYTTFFGLMVFLLSAILWYVLRMISMRKTVAENE